MTKEVQEGQKYGAWLVQQKGARKSYCVCTACGETVKYVPNYSLLNGRSLMCKACSTRTKKESHGMSGTPEYNTWVHMNQRCHNPNNKDYGDYGGRGIEVDPLWRDSFEAFFMMVGPRPFPDATIERVDYNKGYVPGNVKWISREEQVLNKRDNVVIELDGISKTVSQWAEESPVSAFTIYKRVKRGWLEKHGPYDTIFKQSGRSSSKLPVASEEHCAEIEDRD